VYFTMPVAKKKKKLLKKETELELSISEVPAKSPNSKSRQLMSGLLIPLQGRSIENSQAQ